MKNKWEVFAAGRYRQLKLWSNEHVAGLFVFNITLIILMLLRSNDYFLPFFPITINIIVFLAIVLAIILLGLRSNACFLMALLFWLFALFLKILQVDIWAERTAVYSFEFLVVGVVMLLIENQILDRNTQDV